MILTCPKCTTNFVVAREALAPFGRKVKCSKCQTIWFASSVTTSGEDNLESIIENDIKNFALMGGSSTLPAIRADQISKAGYLIPILQILIILITLIIFSPTIIKHPLLAGLTNNIPSSIGLSIENAELVRKEDYAQLSFFVKNSSSEDVTLPDISIILLDEHGKRIKENIIRSDGSIVKANQMIINNSDKLKFKADFKTIEISLGNSLELFMIK